MDKYTAQAIVYMAKTDPGMKDLLDKVEEYWILKGKPTVPFIPTELEREEWNQEWNDSRDKTKLENLRMIAKMRELS